MSTKRANRPVGRSQIARRENKKRDEEGPPLATTRDFHFQQLVDQIDAIVWEADAQSWQFTFVSARTEHILGYPPEQWLSEPNFWVNHLHPDDRDRAVRFCMEATRRAEDHQFEYRAIAADGRIVWLNDIVRVITDEQGRPRLLRGVMVDITPRKRFEEALREAEERFRSTWEQAPVGMAILSADCITTMCNRRFLEITGMRPDSGIGRRLDDPSLALYREDGTLCLPSERPCFLAATCKQPVLDIEFQHPSQKWLLVSAWPVLDRNGDVHQVITTWTDITEQKRAIAERKEVQAALELTNEALRHSEEELRIIFENAGIGMALVSPEGRFLRTNPKLSRILRYAPEELKGVSFADVTHPDDVPISTAVLMDLVSGRRNLARLKKRYIRKDGEICWAWLTGSAMRDQQGRLKYCVSMVEDITKQEAAEEFVRELSVKMLKVQEEEQRRIARELHDSTTQELTALSLNLGAITKSREDVSSRTKRRIVESLRLAESISREIRTVSYLLRPPLLEDFGLWDAIRSFVSEFRKRSGIQVELKILPEVKKIKQNADFEIAIFRFVQEALANVHRHSSSKSVSILIRRMQSSIRISIKDFGRGIPSEILKEIQSNSGRLPGIGIRGMQERIKQIGGNVEITSNRTGTTFRVLAPLITDASDFSYNSTNSRTRPAESCSSGQVWQH